MILPSKAIPDFLSLNCPFSYLQSPSARWPPESENYYNREEFPVYTSTQANGRWFFNDADYFLCIFLPQSLTEYTFQIHESVN